MAATEIKAVSKITVDALGNMAVREVTRFIDEAGNIMAESIPHTKTYQAGDDVSELDGIAREIADKVHTPERANVMQALKAAENARMQAEAKRRTDALKEGKGEALNRSATP